MKTSEQWWQETKSEPEKINRWLAKQYRGEVTAADRIARYCTTQSENSDILRRISEDERRHAGWIRELLKARGIEVDNIDGAEGRYWKGPLELCESSGSFEIACAVGAHAEAMRLERIRTIVMDENAPSDIRETFERILVDEVFHESAFREMTTPAALEAATSAHQEGKRLLGLITTDEAL